MDGIRTFIYGNDVFKALRGEMIIGSSSRKMDLDIVNDNKNISRLSFENEYISPFKSKNNSKIDGILTRRTFRKLKTRIITKIFKVISIESQRINIGQVRVMIPVNLRKKADDIRSTANLTGNIFIDVDNDDNDRTLYNKLINKIKLNEDSCFPFTLKLMRFIPASMINRALKARDEKNLSE